MYQFFLDTSSFRNAWEGIAPQSRCEIRRKFLYINIFADVAGLRSNPLPGITKQFDCLKYASFY